MASAFQILNWEGVTRFLGKVEKKGKTAKQILSKAAGRIANEAVYDHFEEKLSPDGIPWEALSEPYRSRKMAAKGTEDILIWNGHMRGSVRYGANDLAGWVSAGGPDVPYAAAHNFGIPGKMPKRQFVGYGPQEQAIVAESVRAWLRSY